MRYKSAVLKRISGTVSLRIRIIRFIPEEIADVRGISYVYSLLWRFGVIMVPEDVERKLRGSV